ncbi:MAG: hypothetical protein LBE95_02075 [Holosporaceae bacterium]|nr:hypothetical protein [Holosporaceae bacterium]
MKKIIKSGEDLYLLRKKSIKIKIRENIVSTFENIAHEWFKSLYSIPSNDELEA